MKTTPKMKTISKMIMTSKMKMTSKIGPPLLIFFAPPPLPWNYLKFFLWLLTVTAIPQLMLNRKWYQASKPEMEFHMINITYAALHMREQTENTTFACKDDCTLNIDEAHTALDIFRFVVFFFMKSHLTQLIRVGLKWCKFSWAWPSSAPSCFLYLLDSSNLWTSVFTCNLLTFLKND